MGLMEFTQRHGGKLALIGIIGLCSSVYELVDRGKQNNRFVNETKQSVPEYVRLEEVKKDISNLERELNRGITLRDAITLTNPESAERKIYLEMQKRYDYLQEEQNRLLSIPQVKNCYQAIKDKQGETIGNLLAIYLVFSIPFGFGVAGLMTRPEIKKQKPFLT